MSFADVRYHCIEHIKLPWLLHSLKLLDIAMSVFSLLRLKYATSYVLVPSVYILSNVTSFCDFVNTCLRIVWYIIALSIFFINAHNYDLSRPYWRCYFPNTQAIIYVVDSSDTDRLVIAKEEFHAILEVSPLHFLG